MNKNYICRYGIPGMKCGEQKDLNFVKDFLTG